MKTDRLHNIGAEQQVIGSILADNRQFDPVSDLISVEDFADGAHRMIFATVRDMLRDGKAVDIVTVAEALDRAGKLGDVGDLQYLGALVVGAVMPENAAHYAALVRDKAQRRKLAEIGERLAAATELATSADELISETQKQLADMIDKSAGVEIKSFSALLGDFVGDLSERRDREEFQGLPTGVSDLDAKLNGLRAGELIIVAGRPAMGKTAFAMQIGVVNGVEKKNVLVFSLEMTAASLLERAVANTGKIELKAIKSGRFNNDQWDRLEAKAMNLSNATVYIDSSTRLTVERLRSRARQQKARYGLDLIIIDYIQLMEAQGQSRNEQVSTITRGLKLLARELDVPVIALSQLSRKCDERTDKRPMKSDLRDSGAIEQDADVIMTVYRDEEYNPNTDAKGIAEIGVIKNREGETGRVYTAFLGEYSRFENCYYRPPEKEIQTPKRRGFYV